MSLEEKGGGDDHLIREEKTRLPITFTQLRFKVVEITQEQSTPFRNEILKWGWLRWFKRCHFDLSLKVA